ncbi:MAG TPA: hypothetical protein VFO16_02285 [Pseudonocardiaceae bacterium]|nr:hypothetical protein [Pseudonocardiaceae bacterium]
MGSYDMGHCHGLADIVGYFVVRARPGAATDSGAAEARTDLAFLEGAGQYLEARERVRDLNARCGAYPCAGDEFWVDVVYTDGCRMPW